MTRANNTSESVARKILASAVAAGLLGVVFSTIATVQQSYAATGNGAPSGSHYNLNLIGKKKTDQIPNDDNNGHRIFVNIGGKSRIYLQQGDFGVIDADATDGRATFQLPAPENMYDENGNYLGPGKYQVFIRELGKPGGKGTMATCGERMVDTDGDGVADTLETLCSTDIVTLERAKGKSMFEDVTRQLTTVLTDIDGDGDLERVDIFDAAFENYLWEYNNNGLKIVQLRFYEIA